MSKIKRIIAMAVSAAMLFAFSAYIPVSALTSADLSISQNGIEFICSLEGFHSTCYVDSTQSSIGYGTKCTGSSVQPHTAGSHSITREQAMSDMKSQIESTYSPRVRTQTSGITMNQNQFDALVSLCYNCGGGTSRISNSPLVKYLKGELTESEARSQYSSYIVTSGGSVLQGLINRRNKEADLFFTPDESVETHWYDNMTPVDVGTDFYAYIINTEIWKPITNVNGNVVIQAETGNSDQVWKFTRDTDGSYKITNCLDEKTLDVCNFGTTDGTNVGVEANNDTSAQRFFIYGESGAYYFRSKCGDLVLDVNGGLSDDGTNVQMWTYNQSSAQKFQIWKLQTELSVTPGNKASKTLFNWSSNNGSFDFYDIKIWNGTYWVGDTYHIEWDMTGNNFEIDLPAGYYEAYVDARFDGNIVMSNVVAFTVEENYFGQPTLSVTSGDQNSKTQFSWTPVEKANIYHVKIWNGTYWEGEIFHSGWGLTDTSYDVALPPGYYEAYVDAANDETYQMSNVVSFTIEETYNPADINQDNATTIADAVALQKYLLAIKTLTAEQKAAADMNSDGRVNIFDLNLLKAALK